MRKVRVFRWSGRRVRLAVSGLFALLALAFALGAVWSVGAPAATGVTIGLVTMSSPTPVTIPVPRSPEAVAKPTFKAGYQGGALWATMDRCGSGAVTGQGIISTHIS